MDATTTTGNPDVPVQPLTTSTWAAPGPGPWQLDASHVPRPMCAFTAAVLPAAGAAGSREAMARCGSLLEGEEQAAVGGFLYRRARPLGPLADAAGLPAEPALRQLLQTDPVLRERVATAEAVLAERRWRDELRRWDEEVKPRLRALRAELTAVDLDALDDPALCDHVDRCARAFAEGLRQRHVFGATALLPVGDLVVHAVRWSGRPPCDVLACLAGSSPVTAGASQELRALAAALDDDDEAQALVLDRTLSPEQVLGRLLVWPAPVGGCAEAYLTALSALPLDGEDPVGDPGSLEAPALVLARVRQGITDVPPEVRAADEAADRLRAAVPPARREELDALLAEARLLYRLHEERTVHGERALGSAARDALLEVGRRLQRRGQVDDPTWAVDLAPDEVRPLLLQGSGPSPGELAARVRWRETADSRDMPLLLGPPPEPPVPVAWLPPAAARVQEALTFATGAVLSDAGRSCDSWAARGHGVGTGTYEGRARVVAGPHELSRLEPGDVLVTAMTGPAFSLALPLLGALVTDRGGLLSHAAVVAREVGLPAVVGCRDATRVVPDGARVCVDADTGTVTLLEAPARRPVR